MLFGSQEGNGSPSERSLIAGKPQSRADRRGAIGSRRPSCAPRPTCVLNRRSMGPPRRYAVTRNPLPRPAKTPRRSPTARRAPPHATRAPSDASRCRGASRVGGESLGQDLRRSHGAAGFYAGERLLSSAFGLLRNGGGIGVSGAHGAGHLCDSGQVTRTRPRATVRSRTLAPRFAHRQPGIAGASNDRGGHDLVGSCPAPLISGVDRAPGRSLSIGGVAVGAFRARDGMISRSPQAGVADELAPSQRSGCSGDACTAHAKHLREELVRDAEFA